MNIFKKADILIPQNVDFSKWSVVACDQYTSEPEYWEDVKKITEKKLRFYQKEKLQVLIH